MTVVTILPANLWHFNATMTQKNPFQHGPNPGEGFAFGIWAPTDIHHPSATQLKTSPGTLITGLDDF